MKSLVISGGGSKGVFAGRVAEYLTKDCGKNYNTKSRIVKSHHNNSFLYRWIYAVLRDRFATTDLFEGSLSTGIVELFDPLKTITAGTHQLAGPGYIVQLFG